MTDRIIIRDLFLRTIIGINDDERANRQDVLINLALETDTRAAGRSDDIADAMNYRAMTKQVIDLVTSLRDVARQPDVEIRRRDERCAVLSAPPPLPWVGVGRARAEASACVRCLVTRQVER